MWKRIPAGEIRDLKNFPFSTRETVAYDRLYSPAMLRLISITLLGAASFALLPSASASPFPATGPTVPGNSARLRGTQASAPEKAPTEVKRAIWAANQLRD